MYQLEHNGYCNVVVLKRRFAIEVDDYDEKEILLHTIFERSQVGTSELVSLDIDLVVHLLSSFDGKVIYPKRTTKDEIFDEAFEQTSKTFANDPNEKTKTKIETKTKSTSNLKKIAYLNKFYQYIGKQTALLLEYGAKQISAMWNCMIKQDIVEEATSKLSGFLLWDGLDEPKASGKAEVVHECSGIDNDDFEWVVKWANALHSEVRSVLVQNDTEDAE